MKLLTPLLFVCLLGLSGCAGTPSSAFLNRNNSPAPGPSSSSGNVVVTSPTGTLFLSSIHYVAKASSTCSAGVSAINVYSAPGNLVYSAVGSNLDATITLAPGSYGTIVEEVDGCNGRASADVPVTVQLPSTTLGAETSNNTSAANTFRSQTNGNLGART